jgi:phage pi2 protein 07
METFHNVLKKEKYLGLTTLEQEKYIEKKIKEILHSSPIGISISDITTKTPFTRPTVIKHLERLVSCREAYRIKIGNVFVYYPNGKAVYPEKQIKFEIDECKFFKGTLLENNFGKFIFIEIDAKEDIISGGGFLVKREDFPLFTEFINKLYKEIQNDRTTNHY